MTDTTLPHRFERPSAVAFLGYAFGIALIFWCLSGAGFSLDKVMTAPPRFADFADRAFPPNIDPKVLTRLGWKMVETLQIAVAGAVIGAVALVGLPELFRVTAEYRVLIVGLTLLLLVRFRPQGLLGTV